MPGAFKRSLDSKPVSKIKLLWQHSSYEPMGVYTEIREDEKGLFVKGKLPKAHSKAADCIALLKCGALDSMSIGYGTRKDEVKDGVRRLLDVELYEVSIVTFPMNEKATMTGMKSLKKRIIKSKDINACSTKRDLENLLRDSGLTSKKAATIIASWFPDKQSDSVDEKSMLTLLDEVLEKAKKQLN
jgi:HK97 family phage prohead protease